MISAQFLILVPVVLGVVEAAKRMGVASRFAPVLSLVLGVLGVYLLNSYTLSGVGVVEGLIAGLTAAGLWSGVKATIRAY